MDTNKLDKYKNIKEKETIFFWIIFSLAFLGVIAFFVLTLINNEELKLEYISIIIIGVSLFLALIIIFYYVYGAIRFQKITMNVDMYIKDKKFKEGINYLISLKDITYFFISFDKIYYYLSVLYLYDNNVSLATDQLVYIVKYKKTDVVVLFNSIKYLFLIFITSNDSRIDTLKTIYNKEKLSIITRHTINKYINYELNLQIKIINDLISDNSSISTSAMLQYKYFEFVSKYINSLEEQNG